MLSCARMFFTESEAVDLARAYRIDSEPVIGEMSIVFLNGFVRDFTNTWMDKRDGYFFLRGECIDSIWSEMLCKSTRSNGAHAPKAEKQRVRDTV
jgi:hypothetical protein